MTPPRLLRKGSCAGDDFNTKPRQIGDKMFNEKLIERFWKLVNVAGRNDCWNWLAYKNRDGYGNFNGEGKKKWNAHRVSYIIANGEIPDGVCVCHKCDNPSCVNPAHLYLGTHAQNMRDMRVRGRARNHILKNEEKVLIKKSKLSPKHLAELLGVSGRAVAYHLEDS